MSGLRADLDLVILEQIEIESEQARQVALLSPLFDVAKAAAACEHFLAAGVMPPLSDVAALSESLERLDGGQA